MLALAALASMPACSQVDREKCAFGYMEGLAWLQNLQNSDGGWPTFCRGWGRLPFDRSGPDLTAHALRAFAIWTDLLDVSDHRYSIKWLTKVIPSGICFLARTQRSDGSWLPLWFGNQHAPNE